jgi:hypothetical protein
MARCYPLPLRLNPDPLQDAPVIRELLPPDTGLAFEAIEGLTLVVRPSPPA